MVVASYLSYKDLDKIHLKKKIFKYLINLFYNKIFKLP